MANFIRLKSTTIPLHDCRWNDLKTADDFLAAIAGFAGHARIGRLIEGLDFEEDGVWSSHLDVPISDLQSKG